MPFGQLSCPFENLKSARSLSAGCVSENPTVPWPGFEPRRLGTQRYNHKDGRTATAWHQLIGLPHPTFAIIACYMAIGEIWKCTLVDQIQIETILFYFITFISLIVRECWEGEVEIERYLTTELCVPNLV